MKLLPLAHRMNIVWNLFCCQRIAFSLLRKSKLLSSSEWDVARTFSISQSCFIGVKRWLFFLGFLFFINRGIGHYKRWIWNFFLEKFQCSIKFVVIEESDIKTVRFEFIVFLTLIKIYKTEESVISSVRFEFVALLMSFDLHKKLLKPRDWSSWPLSNFPFFLHSYQILTFI